MFFRQWLQPFNQIKWRKPTSSKTVCEYAKFMSTENAVWNRCETKNGFKWQGKDIARFTNVSVVWFPNRFAYKNINGLHTGMIQ